MKLQSMLWFGALAALVGGPACVAATSGAQPAALSHFTVYDLGTLGGTQSSGNAITPAGSVLGNSNPAGDATTLATIWVDGAQTSLGTLGGPNSVIEWPVRNSAVFGGFSETGQSDPLNEDWSCSDFFPSVTHQICLAFRYANGAMTPLPTLGGVNGYGAGVNARGEIVGWAETPVHDRTCVSPQVLQFQAVRYDADGSPHVLVPLPGEPDSAATAINDLDVAVGISGRCDNAVGAYSAHHAVYWVGDTPALIHTFGGKGWNTAVDINNENEIVGFADFPGDVVNGQLVFNPVAFISRHGDKARQIAPLSNDTNSIAYAVNDSGVVVGQSFGGPEGSRAFIWRNGVASDLNGLVSSGGFLYLIYAEGIDDSGAITGQACVISDGACTTTHVAFLAVPSGGHATGQAPTIRVPASLYQQGWRRWGFKPGVTPVAAHDR
jgi:probable HAF family extracellular repeat protein